jgi:hypothetical protein
MSLKLTRIIREGFAASRNAAPVETSEHSFREIVPQFPGWDASLPKWSTTRNQELDSQNVPLFKINKIKEFLRRKKKEALGTSVH